MNVQQQISCIVIMSSLVEFAEIQGLVHTIGGVEANNAGFSSENKSKRQTDIGKLCYQLTTYSEQFSLMKHLIFLRPRSKSGCRIPVVHVDTLCTKSEVKAEIFSTSKCLQACKESLSELKHLAGAHSSYFCPVISNFWTTPPLHSLLQT